MPAKMWILRIVVGLMCVGFAYLLGRSLALPQTRGRRGTGPASWGIRTALAGGAVLWGVGIDLLAIVVYLLAIGSGAAGYFLGKKPGEPEEDPTKQMFPDE
jgi:hypothetical protein